MSPPLLVVRPSGVWNSRAPLHDFIRRSLEISRDYSTLTLAIARVRYEINHRAEGDTKTSVRKYLRTYDSGPIAAKAWNRYRSSWRSLTGEHESQPTFDSLDSDLAIAVYAVREAAVARYSAVFETFVQCWALNMLLAYIHSGAGLTQAARRLATEFSPFRARFLIPGVPAVLKAFPEVDEGLSALPHVLTDPVSGRAVDGVADGLLNAKSVILFWRDFRNSVVHRGGLISHSFCKSHFEVFEALRKPYAGKMKALAPGSRLPLPDVVFSALATTHSRCASWLNERLQSNSPNRGRLRPEGANLPEPKRFEPNFSPGRLLIDGDHSDSLRWLRDKKWRDRLLAAYPRVWRDKTICGNGA